jgi:hypothetical protein
MGSLHSKRGRSAWKAAARATLLPQLDIAAVYRLLCLFDGFLILSAFDILGAGRVTIATDGQMRCAGILLPCHRRERLIDAAAGIAL